MRAGPRTIVGRRACDPGRAGALVPVLVGLLAGSPALPAAPPADPSMLAGLGGMRVEVVPLSRAAEGQGIRPEEIQRDVAASLIRQGVPASPGAEALLRVTVDAACSGEGSDDVPPPDWARPTSPQEDFKDLIGSMGEGVAEKVRATPELLMKFGELAAERHDAKVRAFQAYEAGRQLCTFSVRFDLLERARVLRTGREQAVPVWTAVAISGCTRPNLGRFLQQLVQQQVETFLMAFRSANGGGPGGETGPGRDRSP